MRLGKVEEMHLQSLAAAEASLKKIPPLSLSLLETKEHPADDARERKREGRESERRHAAFLSLWSWKCEGAAEWKRTGGG